MLYEIEIECSGLRYVKPCKVQMAIRLLTGVVAIQTFSIHPCHYDLKFSMARGQGYDSRI